MGKNPGVTIRDLSSVRSMRLYVFSSSGQSQSELMGVFEPILRHLNPALAEGFPLKHANAGIDIQARETVSKDAATVDIAHHLQSVGSPELQAFVQPCEFADPQTPAKKTAVWLATFAEGARRPPSADQMQVVFMSDPIGLQP